MSDKESAVISCGDLSENRMVCGQILSDGTLMNKIDGPQKIYRVNNNGKGVLFEQYKLPQSLEYIGHYGGNDTSTTQYIPPVIVTYAHQYKGKTIPVFKKGYWSPSRSIFLQYGDKVLGYTLLYTDFDSEYLLTNILEIDKTAHKLRNLYRNNTRGEDVLNVRQFPTLALALNKVFAEE